MKGKPEDWVYGAAFVGLSGHEQMLNEKHGQFCSKGSLLGFLFLGISLFFLCIGGYGYLFHVVGIVDRAAARCATLYFVDVIHAFDNLTPHGILAIQKSGVLEADEELAVGAIWQT